MSRGWTSWWEALEYGVERFTSSTTLAGSRLLLDQLDSFLSDLPDELTYYTYEYLCLFCDMSWQVDRNVIQLDPIIESMSIL